MSAQKDDGESGRRRGSESFRLDGVGAEGQCAEGDGRGSGAVEDCVSVKRLVAVRNCQACKNMKHTKSGKAEKKIPHFAYVRYARSPLP